MAVELLMPRLGWTMEEGVFVQWLKQDGEQVNPGDLLFTIEGDKASDDIEAFDSGILRIPPDAPAPGTTISVGTLLGYLVAPGEAAPFEGRTTNDERRTTNDVQFPTPDTRHPAPETPNPKPQTPNPAISPRARRIAKELGVAWAELRGSGRTGRIVERDVRAALRSMPPKIQVSPVARRVAADLQVDLGQLAAQTAGQRITRADVEQAARSEPQPTASAPNAIGVLQGMRRIVATRMAESARTTVPVTLTTDADATELVRLRQQIAADLATGGLSAPSYNDLLAKLVAVALGEHPALNASLTDEGLVQHAAIHIGIAVDAERGLLVPVLRDVGRKSIQQLAAEAADLIVRAREGKASADELRGSTFTISNLGMYEIDAFTPIINLPECAILGVGRIASRAVVIDEETGTLGARKMMALSLTFDHRLVDGAPAARFLRRVKQFVEHPYLWLTR